VPQRPDNETEGRSGCSSNWFGIIIFLIILGYQFVGPLLANLNVQSNTGQRILTLISNNLPVFIVGLVLLSIIIPAITAMLRGINRMTQGGDVAARTGEMQLPSSMQQTRQSPFQGQSSSPTYRDTSSIYKATSSTYDELLSQATGSGSKRALPTGYRSHTPGSHTYGSTHTRMDTRTSVPRQAPSSIYSYHAQQPKTPGFDPIVDPWLVVVGILLIGGGIAVLAGLGWLVTVLP
jgi:hypothetical protein